MALCHTQQCIQPPETEGLRIYPNPFESLPVEILTHILTLAAQSPSTGEIAQYIFPFTALGVCQLWRDIAYSSPRMWTRAVIVMDPDWSRRLTRYTERCGSLPIHLDCITPTLEHLRDYARRLVGQPHIQDKTNVRAARVFGTPSDEVKCLVTIIFLWRFRETLEDLELVLRRGEKNWPENEAWAVSKNLGKVVAQCPRIRSLVVRSLRLPPNETIFPNKFPVLEELHFQACGPHTLQILWGWDMPCLRTFMINGIDQIEEAQPTMITPQGTPLVDPTYRLQTVRVAILKGIGSQSYLQSLLSSIPNATALALTSPPESDPLSAQQGAMASVVHLTIFEPAPDVGALRRFILFRLPALRVVELNERSRTEANGLEAGDMLLLKNQVDIHFLKEDELELVNVLVRMKRGPA
ncbi:hypothetical protein FRB96_001813 [Tulasnella sp. 330]|nr:hypothetical protein FRB96_001813 [Tulasnella sp. 330]